jgi:DNA-binding NarL/FixJ family response regulator
VTTIVLADDHEVVRQGLRALLAVEPDLSVIGETGDGLEVADLVQRLKPDVLVVDLALPGLSGLEITRRVVEQSPKTRVVVLTMYANEAYVVEALRNGATGYVLKRANVGQLVRAVREAAAGRRYLGPPLSDRAIDAYAARTRACSFDAYQTLTSREREALHLAAEGYGNPEIGARLSISTRTAETHRANLMRKLGLQSQTELVRYAFRRGILSLEQDRYEAGETNVNRD